MSISVDINRISRTISKEDIEKLAYKIKDEFFKPINSFKTTIFLCGGNLKKHNNIRYKVEQALSDWWNSIHYDIILPEDIFEELLYSPSNNLLSLENILADSVDVIIVIPESPGSFAELGAFANNEKLRMKIVCLLDKKYKKEKSFINQGPVKLIRHSNKDVVINIDPVNLGKDIHKIHSAIRKIENTSSKVDESISLLQIDNFLLPTIYLLEPVTKDILIDFVSVVNKDNVNSYQVTTIALTILAKKKLIEINNNEYKLTELGLTDFLNFSKTRRKGKKYNETVALDNIRLEILNHRYREKKIKV